MKHTPGPWEVREVDGLFAIAHEDGWVLESDSVEQDRVDARLIAAAPELLELLKEMHDTLLDVFENGANPRVDGSLLWRSRDLLDRFEGEQDA